MASVLCIAGKNTIAVEAMWRLSRELDVVCLPNPSDLGIDDWQPSLRKAAVKAGVPVITAAAAARAPELCFLSLEYSEIIRPAEFASGALFNVHFSLLPLYRGCNTSVWPILRGEAEHGVTLHAIDAGVDTGAVIDQRAFPVAEMTAFETYMTCQRLGLELALEWAPRLMRGEYRAVPQGEGTTFPRKALDYRWKEIDLAEPAVQVVRRVRAFTFPPYQWPTLRGREILAASLEKLAGAEELMAADRAVFLRFAEGT
jgi:methionyl-tRNA formyltransferase